MQNKTRKLFAGAILAMSALAVTGCADTGSTQASDAYVAVTPEIEEEVVEDMITPFPFGESDMPREDDERFPLPEDFDGEMPEFNGELSPDFDGEMPEFDGEKPDDIPEFGPHKNWDDEDWEFDGEMPEFDEGSERTPGRRPGGMPGGKPGERPDEMPEGFPNGSPSMRPGREDMEENGIDDLMLPWAWETDESLEGRSERPDFPQGRIPQKNDSDSGFEINGKRPTPEKKNDMPDFSQDDIKELKERVMQTVKDFMNEKSRENGKQEYVNPNARSSQPSVKSSADDFTKDAAEKTTDKTDRTNKSADTETSGTRSPR